MSLANILKGKISGFFGSATAQLTPQYRDMTIDDVEILKEAIRQIKDMTKTFVVATYTYSQVCPTDIEIPNKQELIKHATSLNEESIYEFTDFERRCEKIREGATNGKIDEDALLPLITEVARSYCEVMASCPMHMEAINAIQHLDYASANTLQTQLQACMDKGMEMSAQLTTLVHKGFTTATAYTFPLQTRQP